VKNLKKFFVVFFSVYALNMCISSFGMKKDMNISGCKRKRDDKDANKGKQPKKVKKSLAEEEKCMICLDSLDTKESKKLRCQKHIFHEECISEHFENDNRCPICRKTEFCWYCRNVFTQDDLEKNEQDIFRNICRRPQDILNKCEHEFHRNCLTEAIKRECPVPVCVRNRAEFMQQLADNDNEQEGPQGQQEVPLVRSDSFTITLYDDQVCVVNEYTNNTDFLRLKQANVEHFAICSDRFLVVFYPSDGSSKECDIFDLQENIQYTKNLKQKGITFKLFLNDRFFLIQYQSDEDKREYHLFDLQENKSYECDFEHNDEVVSYSVYENRFLTIEDSRNFHIFDLQEGKKYIKSQEECTYWAIRGAGLFILFEGLSKCKVFDLQKNKQQCVMQLRQDVSGEVEESCDYIKNDRFFVFVYENLWSDYSEYNTIEYEVFDLQNNGSRIGRKILYQYLQRDANGYDNYIKWKITDDKKISIDGKSEMLDVY